MIFISLIAHVACLFLVKVEVPGRGQFPKRAREVVLLPTEETPRTKQEDVDRAMAWMSWRDPSAVAMPPTELQRPDVLYDSRLPYQPGRLELRKRREKEFPALPSPVTIEVSSPVDQLQNEAQLLLDSPRASAMVINEVKLAELPDTSVYLHGELRDRELLQSPSPGVWKGRQSLRLTFIRLAVSSEGVVQHVFLERSSGDSKADRHAMEVFHRWRFAPGSKGLQWTMAEVHWKQESLRKQK